METYEILDELRREQHTAVASATLDVTEIGPWLSTVYDAVARTIITQGTSITGPPFARYHALGDASFDVEAGFPVTAPINSTDEVHPSSLPGGPAACTIHEGPYDSMEPAYQALTTWLTTQNAAAAGDPWEIYFSDPTTNPDPSTWRTEVVQPYTPN